MQFYTSFKNKFYFLKIYYFNLDILFTNNVHGRIQELDETATNEKKKRKVDKDRETPSNSNKRQTILVE